MSDVHLIGNSATVQSSTAKDLEEPRGRDLLASISARDCSAMGEFYVSYFAPLVNFFAFLTAGDDLVEELISDTMLKAWRESATIGKTASVSVWIMGIAYSRGHAPLRLGSRALEILLTLVERAGEVVKKSELMARVWPDTVVEEGTLRVHIAALRKALGDGQSGMWYVENVTGATGPRI
jgi:DNA-binding response OmpR family regulator